MDNKERIESLLKIMELFLSALQYEHMNEAFEGKNPIDFMCDDSDEDENVKPKRLTEVEEFMKSWKPLSEAWWFKEDDDEDKDEEERDEVTEHVVDHTPEAKCEKLEKEKNHLDFLLDTICDIYGCKKEIVNWEVTILYDPKVLEEVHKVLNKKKK